MSDMQAQSRDKTDNSTTISQQLNWLSSKIQISNNYNLNLVLEEKTPSISSVTMMQDVFKSLKVLSKLKREISGKALKDSDLREYLERNLECVLLR